MENKIEKIKCSFCENILESNGEPYEVRMVHGGAINWFVCSYGSKFDLSKFLLAICDECLDNCEALKEEKYLIGETL